MESAQRPAIPEERDAGRMIVFAVDDKESLAESDLPGDRNALGPNGHCRHGLIRGRPNPVTINLELDGHTNDEAWQSRWPALQDEPPPVPRSASRILAKLAGGSKL